jgi:hypothetical protein
MSIYTQHLDRIVAGRSALPPAAENLCLEGISEWRPGYARKEWAVDPRFFTAVDLVDFVDESIVAIHQEEKPNHDIYHLSSGVDSQTFKELTDALAEAQDNRGPIHLPALEKPFTRINNWLADNLRGAAIGYGATLLKVFIPYLVWNTVFDNTRITSEIGKKPAPFSTYSYPLLRFSKASNFTYPYKDWPRDVSQFVQPVTIPAMS